LTEMRDLYQEVIMDHNRNPRNFGTLEGANRTAEGHNPLCGDNIHLDLLVEDRLVKDLRFSGSGCAISKSSASLMTQAIKGQSEEDAARIVEHFKRLVMRTGGEPDPKVLGKLEVFAGVGEFPARVKCATLAWHALEAALEGKDVPVTTE
jgi:nitrogen fixation protein NifU and related proteins